MPCRFQVTFTSQELGVAQWPRTTKYSWGEQPQRNWDGTGCLGTPMIFPMGSQISKAVQEAVQDFILQYTSSRGTKFQWGVVLHCIEATLHEMELGHHAHPPVDFCPIPWCRNSCKLPLGLFFEQKDKSKRVILGVPFPSRERIMDGCYCCPTFCATTSLPAQQRFLGGTAKYTNEQPSSLLSYLQLPCQKC